MRKLLLIPIVVLGLSGLAGCVYPGHNEPFLVCTRDIESDGNYSAVSPGGQYRGAYQFLQSTWDATARHVSANGTPADHLIGVDPATASGWDQDWMAWELYQWQGNGPWNGRC